MKSADAYGFPRVGHRFAMFIVSLVVTIAVVGVWGSTRARAATPTDVMFLFDTSGSMSEVLEEASAEMQAVMARVETSVPEVEYGVAEVRDYGGSVYDELDDAPWRLITPITADKAAVTSAIDLLVADGGGDAPEAYGRALWETDTNPNVGWRPGARHAIVLIADQVPHMPNVDAGIPEALWFEFSPWDTGEELPGTWGIPGTQLPPGQTLEFLAVLHQLAGDGKPLEMVDYHDTSEENFIHYWEYWAGLAGGQALESGVGTKELAGKLIGLIERAAPPCATTATATVPSPLPGSTLPTALTPRFGQPGTQVGIVPGAGSRFCAGQHPFVGGDPVTSLEQWNPAGMIFRIPPGALGGLSVSGAGGAAGPATTFEVDNFRLPWGFKVRNEAGTGANHTYDAHIHITEEDMRSVFGDLGPSNSIAYLVAEHEAEGLLGEGLCYGFSVISQAVYGDSHGVKHQYPLGWSDSTGVHLSPTTTPYSLKEEASGSHGLTHTLLRAALTQYSQQAKGQAFKKASSARQLQADLDASFQAGQPATLLIHDSKGGHAMLAFNYQVVGSGLAVDVVDPNVPWLPGRPYTDYEALQVQVKANGSWSFAGSFTSGRTFTDPVGGASGSLMVVNEPPMPGGLSFVPSNSSGAGVEVNPGGGDTVTAVNYGSSGGKGIPSDIEPQELFSDAKTNGLVVPSSHQVVTATIKSKSGKGVSAVVVGPGFIDLANLSGGEGDVTVSPGDGTVGAPSLSGGATLSTTSVTGDVQHTATVTFSGRVRRPRVNVGPNGAVTVTTAGGSGPAMIKLSSYGPGDESHLPPKTVHIHGRTKVNAHTPKVKHHHRKHRRHHKGSAHSGH